MPVSSYIHFTFPGAIYQENRILIQIREIEKNNHPIATMLQIELTQNSTTGLDNLFFPSP